jgi:hypothetical protein
LVPLVDGALQRYGLIHPAVGQTKRTRLAGLSGRPSAARPGDGTFQPACRAIGNFGADHSAGGWSADRYPRTVADLTGRR